MQTNTAEKRVTTLDLCAAFGAMARVLPVMFDYSKVKQFAGPATIIKVSDGRQRLNRVLRRDCAEHVVVIDARQLLPNAVVGPMEVANAISGQCRAVLVFGAVYDVEKLSKEKGMPVYATDNSPRVLQAEGGEAWSVVLDSKAGLITNEFYLVGDADGIVAVLKDQMQQHFPVG